MILRPLLLLIVVFIIPIHTVYGQRVVGRDTILFEVTAQETTHDDSSVSASFWYKIEFNNTSLFENISLDSVHNAKHIKLSLSFDIDKQCHVTNIVINGDAKQRYFITKIRQYFHKAKIVIISSKGKQLKNCRWPAIRHNTQLSFSFY